MYGFDIIIKTNVLTLNQLDKDQNDRLELIKDLYEKGLTPKQIAHYLNQENLLTPTGKLYTTQLVFMTHSKYLKRLQRMNNIQVSVKQDYFYVKSGVKLCQK